MSEAREVVAAFVRRDWTVARSYPIPLAVEAIGAAFNLVLFFYLSRLVADAALASHERLPRDYFGFVVVGLALYGWLLEGLASFPARVRDGQATGSLEALLATPARLSLIVVGSVTYDLLRVTVLTAVMLAGAAIFFSFRPEVRPELALILVAGPSSLLLFQALGVIVGAFTIVFKQAAGAVAIAAGAIALLSGAYFPVSLLPAAIRALANLSPLKWALDVMRPLVLGGTIPIGELALLSGSALVLAPLSLCLFARALDRARMQGTVGQY